MVDTSSRFVLGMKLRVCLGDRIKTAFIPGMATTNPFCAERATFEYAVGLDGLLGIA